MSLVELTYKDAQLILKALFVMYSRVWFKTDASPGLPGCGLFQYQNAKDKVKEVPLRRRSSICKVSGRLQAQHNKQQTEIVYTKSSMVKFNLRLSKMVEMESGLENLNREEIYNKKVSI